jgi:sulfoxide reductase catalytic subunit YedY
MTWSRRPLPSPEPTPEHLYLDRRALIAGFTASLGGWLTGCSGSADPLAGGDRPPIKAPRDPRFDLEPTPADLAAGYSCYYEFSSFRQQVVREVESFDPRGLTLKVHGLCRREKTFDLESILATFPQVERVYRMRCVERWAVDVPWTGCELHHLLAAVEPLPQARWVKLTSHEDPDVMPGVRGGEGRPVYRFAYDESLRLSEAMHPLTLLVTGCYGRRLTRVHGAPLRVVVPWKYGYKSPKAVVEIELVGDEPSSFWRRHSPRDHDLIGNVDPSVAFQSREFLLDGKVRDTLPFNGYGPWVASLYA